jgi:hypothetical protein
MINTWFASSAAPSDPLAALLAAGCVHGVAYVLERLNTAEIVAVNADTGGVRVELMKTRGGRLASGVTAGPRGKHGLNRRKVSSASTGPQFESDSSTDCSVYARLSRRPAHRARGPDGRQRRCSG